jgi:REP-associated tyrosine transposase
MPRPRSPRWPGFDYRTAATFFFTICSARRRLLFMDDEVRAVIAAVWRGLPEHYPRVLLDYFVIMPNHVHGIVHLLEMEKDSRGVAAGLRPAATHEKTPQTHGLSQIVNSLKAFSTREVNVIRRSPGGRLWQPTYWDRVLRGPRALEAARKYIAENPANWPVDPLFESDGKGEATWDHWSISTSS